MGAPARHVAPRRGLARERRPFVARRPPGPGSSGASGVTRRPSRPGPVLPVPLVAGTAVGRAGARRTRSRGARPRRCGPWAVPAGRRVVPAAPRRRRRRRRCSGPKGARPPLPHRAPRPCARSSCRSGPGSRRSSGPAWSSHLRPRTARGAPLPRRNRRASTPCPRLRCARSRWRSPAPNVPDVPARPLVPRRRDDSAGGFSGASSDSRCPLHGHPCCSGVAEVSRLTTGTGRVGVLARAAARRPGRARRRPRPSTAWPPPHRARWRRRRRPGRRRMHRPPG